MLSVRLWSYGRMRKGWESTKEANYSRVQRDALGSKLEYIPTSKCIHNSTDAQLEEWNNSFIALRKGITGVKQNLILTELLNVEPPIMPQASHPSGETGT